MIFALLLAQVRLWLGPKTKTSFCGERGISIWMGKENSCLTIFTEEK